MAKLYFNFGAMSCGKTAAMLQVAHNYKTYGYKALVIKPAKDGKGGKNVVSRIGISREADYLIPSDVSVIDLLENEFEDLKCIIADEAQFFEPEQIEEFFVITKMYEIPVICYGLKTDFQSKLFPGSERLLALADEIIEHPTICACGKKARFNARMVDGVFVRDGDQVAIDGFQNVTYKSLCGKCYLEKVVGYDKDMKRPKMLLKNVKND